MKFPTPCQIFGANIERWSDQLGVCACKFFRTRAYFVCTFSHLAPKFIEKVRLAIRNAVSEVSNSLPLRIRDGRKRLRDRSFVISYEANVLRDRPFVKRYESTVICDRPFVKRYESTVICKRPFVKRYESTIIRDHPFAIRCDPKGIRDRPFVKRYESTVIRDHPFAIRCDPKGIRAAPNRIDYRIKR